MDNRKVIEQLVHADKGAEAFLALYQIYKQVSGDPDPAGHSYDISDCFTSVMRNSRELNKQSAEDIVDDCEWFIDLFLKGQDLSFLADENAVSELSSQATSVSPEEAQRRRREKDQAFEEKLARMKASKSPEEIIGDQLSEMIEAARSLMAEGQVTPELQHAYALANAASNNWAQALTKSLDEMVEEQRQAVAALQAAMQTAGLPGAPNPAANVPLPAQQTPPEAPLPAPQETAPPVEEMLGHAQPHKPLHWYHGNGRKHHRH